MSRQQSLEWCFFSIFPMGVNSFGFVLSSNPSGLKFCIYFEVQNLVLEKFGLPKAHLDDESWS